jgi:hypothetical protein
MANSINFNSIQSLVSYFNRTFKYRLFKNLFSITTINFYCNLLLLLLIANFISYSIRSYINDFEMLLYHNFIKSTLNFSKVVFIKFIIFNLTQPTTVLWNSKRSYYLIISNSIFKFTYFYLLYHLPAV